MLLMPSGTILIFKATAMAESRVPRLLRTVVPDGAGYPGSGILLLVRL